MFWKQALGLCSISLAAGCGGSSALPFAATPSAANQSVFQATPSSGFLPLTSPSVGAYVGSLTQPNGPDGSPFNFAIYVRHTTATTFSGSSRIERNGNYADITVTATVSGSTIKYQEGSITSQTPGTDWCIKSATLTLSADRTEMKGPWTAPAQDCIPGTIDVKLTK